MERTYLMTTNHGDETHRYTRADALEVFGQERLWELDTGATVQHGTGTAVDLVAYFHRTQA